jgi:hypothetical protein
MPATASWHQHDGSSPTFSGSKSARVSAEVESGVITRIVLYALGKYSMWIRTQCASTPS